MRNNKGFSLTELMLVISVIGALAITVVPSTLSLRNSIREQSVSSNIIVMRSFLEMRSFDRERSNLMEVQMLSDALDDFTRGYKPDEFALINPFTFGNEITTDMDDSLLEETSVVVYTGKGNYKDDFIGGIDEGNVDSRGKLYVQVFDDAYVLWSRDRNGMSTNYYVVK